ncbi:hypothetical protein AB6A40_005750 [Gnathostoma spinigerum]|uniref:Uncharacterized protein n=1 Tax=Gnathostoma spinigerum TaxID=75299 RepID=A0ABD6EH46_9BILA
MDNFMLYCESASGASLLLWLQRYRPKTGYAMLIATFEHFGTSPPFWDDWRFSSTSRVRYSKQSVGNEKRTGSDFGFDEMKKREIEKEKNETFIPTKHLEKFSTPNPT